MADRHFVMVSEWMDNGNINEFIKANQGANRFELVGFSCSLSYLMFITPPNSSKTSLEG